METLQSDGEWKKIRPGLDQDSYLRGPRTLGPRTRWQLPLPKLATGKLCYQAYLGRHNQTGDHKATRSEAKKCTMCKCIQYAMLGVVTGEVDIKSDDVTTETRLKPTQALHSKSIGNIFLQLEPSTFHVTLGWSWDDLNLSLLNINWSQVKLKYTAKWLLQKPTKSYDFFVVSGVSCHLASVLLKCFKPATTFGVTSTTT